VSVIEKEKNEAENSLKNSQIQAKDLEERLKTLNTELQLSRQENAQKSLEIEDLKSKTRLIDEKDRELYIWKEKYDLLQRKQSEEIINIRRQFDAELRIKVIFL